MSNNMIFTLFEGNFKKAPRTFKTLARHTNLNPSQMLDSDMRFIDHYAGQRTFLICLTYIAKGFVE